MERERKREQTTRTGRQKTPTRRIWGESNARGWRGNGRERIKREARKRRSRLAFLLPQGCSAGEEWGGRKQNWQGFKHPVPHCPCSAPGSTEGRGDVGEKRKQTKRKTRNPSKPAIQIDARKKKKKTKTVKALKVEMSQRNNDKEKKELRK